MTTINVGSYAPPGPTVARFHASSAMIRPMAGPIGSGKTTGLCWDAIFTTMLQTPQSDGVRRAKVGMLRDTYRNLYGTTLQTWFKSFPRTLGDFVGSDDRPFTHALSFPAPYLDARGQPTAKMGACELVVEGRALGAHSVEATCRGWEIVLALCDEWDLLPEEATAYLLGRSMRAGDPRYRVSRGVAGTFNKPDIDHHAYRMCVEEIEKNRWIEVDGRKIRGLEFFDQPPGLLPGGPPYRTNPEAENLQNLDDGYYVLATINAEDWYIRRMLRNEWGATVSGERVYTGYSDERHLSPVELEPEAGDELVIGLDAGGTPAAVILGRTRTGRRIVYAEVVMVDPMDPRRTKLQHGVGPNRFARELRDLIASRFRRNRFRIGYADPASYYGADRPAGEYAWPETVGQLLEIPIQPAPSNEVDLRLDAVKSLLYGGNDYDGKPNLIINRSCTFLRRGFVSDYKYEARDPKQPGKTLKPQKTTTSHVHDALQYACLGDVGRAGVVAGRRFDRHRTQPAAEKMGMTFADDSRPPWTRRSDGSGARGGGPSYATGFNLWRS